MFPNIGTVCVLIFYAKDAYIVGQSGIGEGRVREQTGGGKC